MNNFIKYSFLLCAIILLVGCLNKDRLKYKKKDYDKEVIVFYPSWKQNELNLKDIPWDKITRIIYAFAAPNPDGSLNTTKLTQMRKLVRRAHTNGVEVYISLGGNYGGKDLPTVSLDKVKRKKFVSEIAAYATKCNLDGIDVDWEYLSHGKERHNIEQEQMALVVLLHDLRKALQPLKKSLSIDVYGSYWGGRFFLDEALQYVDQVHIMAYDYAGKWSDAGPHSSLEQTIGNSKDKYPTGLAYWMEIRKWDKDKLYLGVPFYGRDFNHKSVIGKGFKEIAKEHPEAIKRDSVNNIYFNGQETIKQKAKLVQQKGLPGMMVWEITHDAVGEESLLNVIDKVFN
jgi:chitinase